MVAEIVRVAVSAPETRPPLESGVAPFRHWYVSVGWPWATTENCASEPAQRARLVGAETDKGTRSCAPMSTIGGEPAPVSGAPGSSKKRGRPATSVVVPTGTAPLFPASTTGEPAPGRRSPGGARKSGFAEIEPVPLTPSWLSL